MASAKASTWATVAMGRLGADSLPAPRIRQGLRWINSSSAAVCKIAFSSRYALATVVAPVAASRSARHVRTPGGVISSRSYAPKVGRR